jgi:hypothetical protein
VRAAIRAAGARLLFLPPMLLPVDVGGHCGLKLPMLQESRSHHHSAMTVAAASRNMRGVTR